MGESFGSLARRLRAHFQPRPRLQDEDRRRARRASCSGDVRSRCRQVVSRSTEEQACRAPTPTGQHLHDPHGQSLGCRPTALSEDRTATEPVPRHRARSRQRHDTSSDARRGLCLARCPCDGRRTASGRGSSDLLRMAPAAGERARWSSFVDGLSTGRTAQLGPHSAPQDRRALSTPVVRYGRASLPRTYPLSRQPRSNWRAGRAVETATQEIEPRAAVQTTRCSRARLVCSKEGRLAEMPI